VAIDAFLQAELLRLGLDEGTAVEAARWLDEAPERTPIGLVLPNEEAIER
jgi:hypothetical protein